MTRRRAIFAWIVTGGAVIALLAVAAVPFWRDGLRTTARRDWKDRALANIVSRLGKGVSLTSGIPTTTRSADLPGQPWAGGDVLVMANGEWIACQNICRKEDPRVHDLFLGRGSDGRWYYSTFHFCKGRVVLLDEPQPAGLAEFVDAYWLVPFDGKSDDCLTLTWTGTEPWGAAKQRGPTSTATAAASPAR